MSAVHALAPSSEIVVNFPFTPGQYLVNPGQGMCVVSAYRKFETMGVSYAVLQCSSLKDPKASRSVPAQRVAESGLRLPSDIAELDKIFALFDGKKPVSSNKRWLKKREDYEDQFKTGDVVTVAGIVHSVLGKHRDEKLRKEFPLSDLPAEIAISYSEREVVLRAVDFLGEELAHVTGRSEKDARNMIFAGALIPGYAKSVKLESLANAKTHMPEKDFKALFGINFKEASDLDSPKRLVVLSTPRERIAVNYSNGGAARLQPVSSFGKAAGLPSNFDPKPQKPKKELRPSVKQQTQKASDGFITGLAPDMKAIYRAERPHIPDRGITQPIAKAAANILNAEEFAVFSAIKLRAKEHRLNPDALAVQRNADVEDIIALHDSAGLKLKTHFTGLNSNIGQLNVFNPFGEKIAKPIPEANMTAIKKGPAALSVLKEKPPKATKLVEAVPLVAVFNCPDHAKAGTAKAEKPGVKNKSEQSLAPKVRKTVVQPALPAHISAEAVLTPQRGVMRGFFNLAAKILDPDEFDVMAKTALRFKSKRIPVAEVARLTARPVEAVIRLHDSAAAKMQAAMTSRDGDKTFASMFKPYVPKLSARRPAHAAKEPKVETDVRPNEIVLRIAVPMEQALKHGGLNLNVSWDRVAGVLTLSATEATLKPVAGSAAPAPKGIR